MFTVIQISQINMRIAFIGQKVIPAKIGGTEKYVEEVSLCMARAGHSVFVYGKTHASKKMLANKNIYFISLPSLGEFFETLLATLHAIFEKYDVIHFQSESTFFLSKLVGFLEPKTKIVSSFDLLCDLKNKPGSSVRATKEIDAISKLNIRSKRYMLFAHNLKKTSGAHYLIEAFKQMEDTAKTPNNFKLVLLEVGERDEDYVKYLHTISEGRSNIILIRPKSTKMSQQLFSHAYLFVESSEILENPSALLMKAMSFALTPVVSNIKENIEVVGEAGFSFVSKSVLELRDRLAYLLSRNDEVEKFGKLAKEKIEREYSWETIAQKSIEV